MKKAYELSTLTGTQVLLLVVSETGLVYTFTTAKLQPLSLSRGQESYPSMLERTSWSASVHHACRHTSWSFLRYATLPSAARPTAQCPGGLSIGGKEEDGNDDGDNTAVGPSAEPDERGGRKRRRADSTSTAPARPASGAASSGGPPPPPPPPPASNSPTGASQQPPPPRRLPLTPLPRHTVVSRCLSLAA
ncbi:hypothetical protein BC629DRAFT_318636 [Irpex lacteus]|nr:hypothetical protein BC629DRAFT_318636 [Irpex lacteus]